MYSCEGEAVYFVFQRTRLPFFKAPIKNLCLIQGPEIAGVVLHRVGIFGFFCPKGPTIRLLSEGGGGGGWVIWSGREIFFQHLDSQ